ncbi:uncharacterized protein BN776_01435 [Clostridium sp. CAG:768]|nr:uncharacterized protein BN776_01435 [Clostridium sp. CAG:768]
MWKDILINSLTHVWEWFALIIPTIISLVLTWYPLGNLNNISSKVFITIIIILFISLAYTIKLLITTVHMIMSNYSSLPKLKAIKRERLIFTPSDLFAPQTPVAIYYKDDIEEFIAYGTIETITTSTRYIQVIVEEFVNDKWDMDKLDEIKNKIIIKPSIPNFECREEFV